VVVECRGCRNAQVIDDNLAGAIGEAPACGGALLKENPGSINLFLGNELNACDVTAKELMAGLQRAPQFTTSQEQGQRFIDAVICRDERRTRSWSGSMGRKNANQTLVSTKIIKAFRTAPCHGPRR
jgi:hypothetical protein